MKRFLIPLAFLLTAVGCIESEQPFVIEGDPHFNITIRDDSGVPIAELDEMSAQYSLVLGSNAWSAAKNPTNHVSFAPRFYVNSNMRWKVVPASGEPESWIHPFPDSGEKEGLFFFKTDRNIDPELERSALFNILVDKGSGEFEPIEGMLRVTQEKSLHFLEMNAAKFNVAASGQRIKLAVTANVDWDYSIVPSPGYGTPDLEWITDESKHTAGKQVDTLVFKVAANELGVRGADLTVNYVLDGEAKSELIPITQYPATETTLEGFPVKWAVRISDNTYAETWPASGTIQPTSGSGLITWHNEAGRAADTAGKVVLDVSDKSPRAAGVWPGDYLEFVAASPVSAGTIVKLVFATRVSGTGQKYWRLEFRDGDQWKIAGQSYTDPEVIGPDGQPVVYTHTMAPDGSTNILVEALANYSVTTDQVEFRFICAANYQANGNGPLGAPNGGTWRLTVNGTAADDPYQPQISIVAAGAESLTKANLTINPAYLAFEGEGMAGRKFTVSCDQDFTLTPSAGWIHVSATESSAGEDLSFTVTCDDNHTKGIREGAVTIKAGITRADIAIIQGAVGGGEPGKEPFISIDGGNKLTSGYKGGEARVTVLSNLQVSASSNASWLKVTPDSGNQADVEEKVFNLQFEENAGSDRTASVRFYNDSYGLETVLTFVQGVSQTAGKVWFEDDFEWLAQYTDAYLAKNPSAKLDPVGSNLSTHDQPNLWNDQANFKVVTDDLYARGYVDLNPSPKVLYMQRNYFKMGKTNAHTGLRLPPCGYNGDSPSDVTLTFDWCAHMTGSGVIDNVTITVEVEGAGFCADSGTVLSKEIATAQTAGTLAWQHASVSVRGVTKDTRIVVRPTHMSDGKGASQQRWHFDNIRIISE